MKTTLIAGLLAIGATASVFGQVAVVDEDFDGLSLGDTTGINQEITGAGLRLHNHILGEVVTPNAGFTSASGQAFELKTGTNPAGGWGIISADNSPRLVSLSVGEEIVLSFDMYIQAIPEGTANIKLYVNLTGADNIERNFTEYTGASVGDVIHVSWTNTVTAPMTAATAISPGIGFEGNIENYSTTGPNGDGTGIVVGQIDNLKLEAAPAAASAYYVDAVNGNNNNTGTSPANAWKTLDKASTMTLGAGEQLLLNRGDTFVGKLLLDNENGAAGLPIVIGAYGTGDRPVIDATGYVAGIQITSCDYITIQDLEITGDSGAHIDGSDGTDRYGIWLKNSGGGDSDHITVSNVYFHTIYPYLDSEHEGHNPTTYTGYGIKADGQNGNHSQYLTVVDCHFENLGMSCLNMSRQDNVSILNNLMENIGGPAMVPNRCHNLLVRGNTVDGTGQFTDPRMHGRGSGIWPINCNTVLIEKNAFMHARGRYDSCGVHLDIGNKDAIVQYNLSMDNEGGFVEILGVNENCSYRYNISINDGNRRSGLNENGLTQGSGHTILFSSHNFNGQPRHGPYWNYIYNNTIFVKRDQHASFSVEQGTLGILVANNIFYIESELEDENPYWRGDYTNNLPGTAIWTNNVYQRGGIYPQDWIFEEGNPIYANPQFPNAGGLTATDYIPMAGSIVEGRSIDIPVIPGDPNGGLAVGFEVTEDFFGNPIQGQPDIGAVEIGGGTSAEIGSAFHHWPEVHGDMVEMTAVAGPAGSEYYFEEMSGHFGGADSGWQTSSNFNVSGLLPNTPYTYAVTTRDANDVVLGTSIVEDVVRETTAPYPMPILFEEDFTTAPDPENATSPFPLNTWHLNDNLSDMRENQVQSVTISDKWMQLGFGYDEIRVMYFMDQLWGTHRDYEFTGDWKISTLFSNHIGFNVGFGEFHPVTGELLNMFGEMNFGDTVSPTTNSTGSFMLSITAAELQLAGVSPTNRVGIYFHRDNGTDKNDIYLVDNLFMHQMGDDLDADGDGIPDSIEDALGVDLEADEDYDGDGLSNAEEILVGRSVDVADAPLMAGITNGTEVVVYEPWVLSDRGYVLEHKDSLMSSNGWKAVDFMSGSVEAGNGDYAFPRVVSVKNEAFYRLRVEWE